MRTNKILLATGLIVFSLFGTMSCDKDEVEDRDANGCIYPKIYGTIANVPEPTVKIERARLRDGCLEVVWRECDAELQELTMQEWALASYLGTYTVSLRIKEKSKAQCFTTTPDSASFSLRDLRGRHSKPNLRFEDLDGLVIEVR